MSSLACLKDSWAPDGVLLTVMRWTGRAPSVQRFTRRTFVDDVRRAGFVDVEIPEVGAQPTVAVHGGAEARLRGATHGASGLPATHPRRRARPGGHVAQIGMRIRLAHSIG